MEYELSASARSLFASDGTLHLPYDKYELMKQTENIAVPNSQNLQEKATAPESRHRVDIVDAMVQVESMKKDLTIKTGKDFADAFVNRVEKLVSNSNDRYLEGSLKRQTKRKRTKGCNPIKYKASDTMDMKNISMKSLLSQIETKSELTYFLKDKILQNYSSSNKRIESTLS